MCFVEYVLGDFYLSVSVTPYAPREGTVLAEKDIFGRRSFSIDGT